MQAPQPYAGGGNTCLRGWPSRFRRIVPMAKKNKGGKKGASTAAVALLKETETPFEIREYEHVEGETSFGLEAAQKLGADPEQVFKTLLIVHDKDFAVAVVPVSGQLNLKAAAHALGWKSASMCDPKIAERRTGYVVGGISPLGQKTPSPTLLDASAEQYRTIMVSGGKRGLDIELSPADLLKLTGGNYAPLPYEDMVVRARADYEREGFCLYTVLADGEVAGFTGAHRWVNDWGPTGQIELAWRLGCAFWGEGIATRAAQQVMGELADAGHQQVYAVIHTRNRASAAVAQRLGMHQRSSYEAQVNGLALPVTEWVTNLYRPGTKPEPVSL